jgi:endo-1,4-beta-xylanase
MKNIFRHVFSVGMVLLMSVMVPVVVNGQLAAGKCKFLGNIISGSVPSDFNTYWNQVTPENGGKWGSTEATRDVMNWTQLDLAYNKAINSSFPFKQHTFVWGNQQPTWIGTLSAAEQKEEVEEWIKAFCERYPQTDFIDVVNEPLHAVPNYAAALGGGGLTGWDWVIWSFEKARQYCPNAKLILNDYNIINNNSATDSYITIINVLKQRGLIDLIGEQGHFLETTPLNTIKQNLDKLHATGLPIVISEYDINITDDNAQRDKYQEQFTTLWTHAGVEGITLWGYRQGQIWRENAYLVRSNGTERPALTWLKTFVANDQGGNFCLPPVSVENDHSGIEVYPIPAAGGNFTVKLGAGEFDISVFDLNGKVKKEMKVSGNEPVNVHMEAASGVYIMKIFDGRRTVIRKVILD